MAQRFFATAPRGIEALLAEELRGLGAVEVDERRAGVAFSGPLEAAYRACLWSRTASRILLPLATFPAPDEAALYDGVRGIAWEEHLPADGTLAVDAVVGESAVAHSHFAALRTKDAVVDRLRDLHGRRPSVDRRQPDLRINLRLHRDEATVSLDLSGDSLHRRGYRAEGAQAPLKESLAAALLLLAGWPDLARRGAPLLDPMCGSGTILVEAALIALDRAPNAGRRRFGFSGWRSHDERLWARLLAEAAERRRDSATLPPLVGRDVDEAALRAARGNLERAGLGGRVLLEKVPLEDGTAVDGLGDPPRGLLLTNPPYGERLGEAASLRPLYRALGDALRRRFPGWTGCVLAGNLDLVDEIGLRPSRRHVLWNGPIECRLLVYPIDDRPVSSDEGPAWRRPYRPSPAAEMLRNRLLKNLRHLRKWARREGVTCFRVYDADLPEYAVAVDLYGDAAQVQEYAPPATIEPERAAAHLRDAMAVIPEALDLPPESVFLKVRRRQRGEAQYERLDERRVVRVVEEAGCRFEINLSDYLDTGLFLDHRLLRGQIARLAAGRRFLNLFAYTGTATVAAARGGAASTTSVDLSNTYLDWAARNLRLNALDERRHELVRADCLEWLARPTRRYDLILVAPPSFSNSRAMRGTFDVQRDHVSLLRSAAAWLADDGVLLFSNALRRFRMNAEALDDLTIEDVSRETLPPDFARDPRGHNVWRIARRRPPVSVTKGL